MPNALHIAIWNGDLEQIQQIITERSGEETRKLIEEKDTQGNRSLHLALKLKHNNMIDIVSCLLDAGARVRSRDAQGWKTLHHVIAARNKELLKILIQKGAFPEKNQASFLWQSKVDAVSPCVIQISDFYCELAVDVGTWVPGLSRWFPSDSIRIWKRRHDLRIDITLVGFENGSWKRGSVTFLLLGKRRALYCLDHDAKTCSNLLETSRPLEPAELEEIVNNMMGSIITTTNVTITSSSISRRVTWLHPHGQFEDVGNWKCAVYELQDINVSLHVRQRSRVSQERVENLFSESILAQKIIGIVSHAEDQTGFASLVVEPKSSHQISIQMKTDETFHWRFFTENYDIAFGVKFFTKSSKRAWIDVIPLSRVVAHTSEQTGSYQAKVDGTIKLTWDNNYSNLRSKTLYYRIRSDRTGTVKDSSGAIREAERLYQNTSIQKDRIGFKEWFHVDISDLPADLQELRPKHYAVQIPCPPCRTLKKTVSASLYLSDQFPISIEEFLPVVKVLASTNDTLEHIETFFQKVCNPRVATKSHPGPHV
uniref:Uncharacterized protein AlNc14C11G1388 n=1 Tax=Albugo laibachii Nc14 TaxID=890382 RepID=F0W309_9STRA|nr:conserved hypothetical protein [Albugo laibachii Nc14]|eukprot:CCA15446.1 conserved hypothetical protein [Albugo laibachii Nc14]